MSLFFPCWYAKQVQHDKTDRGRNGQIEWEETDDIDTDTDSKNLVLRKLYLSVDNMLKGKDFD
jgi:hypothetical protein